MAAASGKDVRDILNLPDRTNNAIASSSTSANRGPPTASAGGGPPTRAKASTKPKMDGITRELHALLGDNAPSLAVAHHEARAMLQRQEAAAAASAAGGDSGEGSVGLRPKFKRREKKAVGWRQKGFKNPARQDELVLNHWVQAKKDENNDQTGGVETTYPFTIFNSSSGVYTYSSDEYTQHLRDEDWTKEETDYLIDLCQLYDLRFVIIADRWDWPPSTTGTKKPRSIEDLKARYYAICRRLIRSRISVDDMDSRTQLLQTYAFDKSREIERKKHLAKLFTRTPAQLAEEEALYVEARRLEQQEAKFAADREDLLKLLGGWERVPNVSMPLVAEAGAGLGAGVIPGTPGFAEEAALNDAKRKKRRVEAAAQGSGSVLGLDDDTPSGSTSASGGRLSLSSGSLTAKQKAELKQAHFDELNNITRFDPDSTPLNRPPYPFLVGVPSTAPPLAPSPNNPSSSHGVYFRSARLLAPRQPQYNRTMQSLAETTPPIGPRLVFPTRSNCEKWEGLLGAVTSGLEMKKQTDRVESELRIARNRVNGLLNPQLQQTGRASSAGAGGGRGSTAGRGSTPLRGGRSSRSRTPAVAPTAVAATSVGEADTSGVIVKQEENVSMGDQSMDQDGGASKDTQPSKAAEDEDEDDEDDDDDDAAEEEDESMEASGQQEDEDSDDDD